jgi:Ion channel
VERLHELGYGNVRHYRGGIADWKEAGGPLESRTAPIPEPSPTANLVGRRRVTRRPQPIDVSHWERWGNTLPAMIERCSTSQLFFAYLAMIILCGGVYWLAGFSLHHHLVVGGTPVDTHLGGLATAIYFSFITATSVGYGDVVPLGALRLLAATEAVAALLIFGAVITKFVSRRQDEIIREIQRVTFEERLDRVQTNLHLVLSEFQVVAAMCDDGTCRPERMSARLESVTLVFAGELRAIHTLLYQPNQMPEEPVLGAILASLAASLHELSELLGYLPTGFLRSPTLEATLKAVARLAEEICGECVPRVYAPALTVWMDRIQEIAGKIA